MSSLIQDHFWKVGYFEMLYQIYIMGSSGNFGVRVGGGWRSRLWCQNGQKFPL